MNVVAVLFCNKDEDADISQRTDIHKVLNFVGNVLVMEPDSI
jgi:hypothetical protein